MNYMNPAPPTWRLCHPVNIYVFKNGIATEKPQLVHIPMDKKKNMKTVLEEIGSRMKLQVGYPVALYDMDGTRICQTYELEMYHYYVVVTNIEKRFKCADYGKTRGPLVVIGHHSKHVNSLKTENRRYDLFCRSKFKRRLHEMMPHGERNGLGPTELPPCGPPCGTLCTKIRPMMNVQPTQVCSDEIMCVGKTERGVGEHEPLPAFCRDMPKRKSNKDQCGKGSKGQLMNLITRYQHVGSEIFKMFQDRMTDDFGNASKTDSKWGLPSTGADRDDSLLKVQQELMKLAQASCRLNIESLVGQGCPVEFKTDAGAAVRSMMADNFNGGHTSEALTAGQSMYSDNTAFNGGHENQALTAGQSMYSDNNAVDRSRKSQPLTAGQSMYSDNTALNGGRESQTFTARRSFNGGHESQAVTEGRSMYSDNNAVDRSRKSQPLAAEQSMYSDNTALNGRRESQTLTLGRSVSLQGGPEMSLQGGPEMSLQGGPEMSLHGGPEMSLYGGPESQAFTGRQSRHSENTTRDGRRNSQALTARRSIITDNNYELNEGQSEEISRRESQNVSQFSQSHYSKIDE